MKWPLVLIICLCYISSTEAQECPQNDKYIVCYYGSWSFYRDDEGKYNVSLINPELCTHIVYAFAGLDRESKANHLDFDLDVTKGNFNAFINLKEQNPCVKLLLAIGGWNEGSRKYSVMASTPESRHAFAESALRFLVHYGFDGLDFDWEYPTSRGGILEDRSNFSELLRILSERLRQWDLLLTIAVPMSIGDIEDAYDISALDNYVDYVSIMAYDYTPTNSATTGLLAPFSEIEKSINYWKSKNFPVNKLVLGLPSYARTFTLADPDDHGIGAITDGPGRPGRFTKEAGFLSYYELQLKMQDGRYQTVKLDENYYAFYKTDWMSYDTFSTYQFKTQYAVDNNLRGVMLWTMDTDDFSGQFGEEYTILHIIKDIINP